MKPTYRLSDPRGRIELIRWAVRLLTRRGKSTPRLMLLGNRYANPPSYPPGLNAQLAVCELIILADTAASVPKPPRRILLVSPNAGLILETTPCDQGLVTLEIVTDHQLLQFAETGPEVAERVLQKVDEILRLEATRLENVLAEANRQYADVHHVTQSFGLGI